MFIEPPEAFHVRRRQHRLLEEDLLAVNLRQIKLFRVVHEFDFLDDVAFEASWRQEMRLELCALRIDRIPLRETRRLFTV